MLDLFSCTECGRCQDVCPAYATGKELVAKAADHGPARPRCSPRGRTWWRWPSGRDRQPLVPNAVTDDVVWDCVTCGACVYECPVYDRARRHDRRPPPPPGDGRGPVPGRGRLRCSADVERSVRTRGASLAERAGLGRRDWACGCWRPASRRPRSCTGWAAPAPSTSGRGRRRVSIGPAAAGRGRGLRDPGPARVVHRRPGAADGQRVPVPGARRAERRDAERPRRHEDRHRLPALLQHAGERVPRLRRHASRCCTTPSCWLGWCATAGSRRRRARPLITLRCTTPAIWAGTTTSSTRPGSWEPRPATHGRDAARGDRSFCCGAGGARMWMEERRHPINEERVRRGRRDGRRHRGLACPYCTVMLDDGVRSSGDEDAAGGRRRDPGWRRHRRRVSADGLAGERQGWRETSVTPFDGSDPQLLPRCTSVTETFA